MMAEVKKHIVITGTGRAGTTFLVELLTHLGLDTGFSTNEIEFNKDKISNAGLEHKVGELSSPYIVKDPLFVDYAEDVLNQGNIEIEHVFIPMREISAVADSRRMNQKDHFGKLSLKAKFQYLMQPYLLYGGLLHTTSSKIGVQEEILTQKLFDLIMILSRYQIPITFVQFPYFISQPRYLYAKLTPVLKDVSFDMYIKTFEALADPEKPRDFDVNKK